MSELFKSTFRYKIGEIDYSPPKNAGLYFEDIPEGFQSVQDEALLKAGFQYERIPFYIAGMII